MRLVKLQDQDGEEVLINPDRVCCVKPSSYGKGGPGAVIEFGPDHMVYVTSPPGVVAKELMGRY
jgi:hypothetical protein